MVLDTSKMKNISSFINLTDKLSERKKNLISYFCIILFLILDFILGIFSPYEILTNRKGLILGIFSGFLIFVVNLLITKGLKQLGFSYSKAKNQLFYKSVIFSDFINIIIIILSIIFEELIFRSYLLAFTNNYLIIYLSIAINAITFYLLHFNKRIIQLILMGICFSVITIYTNSVFPAIIGHIINNALCLYEFRLKNREKIG